MEHQDELFDDASLRRVWLAAGVDVAAWDVEPALGEARRLADAVERLRTLDDGLLAGQLKSTSPEEIDEMLRACE